MADTEMPRTLVNVLSASAIRARTERARRLIGDDPENNPRMAHIRSAIDTRWAIERDIEVWELWHEDRQDMGPEAIVLCIGFSRDTEWMGERLRGVYEIEQYPDLFAALDAAVAMFRRHIAELGGAE